MLHMENYFYRDKYLQMFEVALVKKQINWSKDS